MLDEKPVTMAVNMFASGELKLSDSDVSVESHEDQPAEESAEPEQTEAAAEEE